MSAPAVSCGGSESVGCLTAVDDVVLVQVVDGAEYLLDCLRGILLSELALLANSIEQLAACSQLGDNVELVLLERVVKPRQCSCFLQ